MLNKGEEERKEWKEEKIKYKKLRKEKKRKRRREEEKGEQVEASWDTASFWKAVGNFRPKEKRMKAVFKRKDGMGIFKVYKKEDKDRSKGKDVRERGIWRI